MALAISVKRRVVTIDGRLAALIRKFGRADDGATAVEFALVSIPFLGLLFAIFETAFVFFATQGVEAAVNDAARYVMTGQVQYDGTIKSASDFKTKMICSPTGRARILPSFIKCSDLVLHIEPAASFTSAVVSTTIASEKYCTGAPGDIVVVRLLYPMPVYLSILSMSSLASTGTTVNQSALKNYKGKMVHLLMGTAVFRNEPFSATGTPAVTSGC